MTKAEASQIEQDLDRGRYMAENDPERYHRLLAIARQNEDHLRVAAVATLQWYKDDYQRDTHYASLQKDSLEKRDMIVARWLFAKDEEMFMRLLEEAKKLEGIGLLAVSLPVPDPGYVTDEMAAKWRAQCCTDEEYEAAAALAENSAKI